MPTPYPPPLTYAQLQTMESKTVGNLRPYEVQLLHETLDRIPFERGGDADVSEQPTITTIRTNLNGQNP